jgi:NAD(P)H dehydrogenase (quinone)
VAVASIDDAAALTKAYAGTDGVFLMTPPNYDPESGFPDTRANAAAIKSAIEAGRPGKVVFLSTVSHQLERHGLAFTFKQGALAFEAPAVTGQ